MDRLSPHVEQLPLSFGQEQLWFLDRLDPGLGTYNNALFHRLRGPLDVGALTRALTGVVARHEALRATFAAPGGSPEQTIVPPGPVPLPVEELAGGDAALGAVLDGEAARPFDLSTDGPLRARLLRLGPDDHVLCLTIHHIAVDGWSIGVLTDELARSYNSLVRGDEPGLDGSPVRYGDYVLWQREWLRGPALEDQLRYWERTLAGAPALDLPADRPRPATPSFAGDVVSRDLDPALAPRLAALGRQRGASLLMVLVAALDVVLARVTGEDDLSVGTTMLGRTRPELQRVVGYFVNMVVLRVDTSGDPTFEELLGRVRDRTLGAFDHQDVPFDKVVDRVGGPRDPSRNPLFQLAVQLLPTPAPPALTGVDTEVVSRPCGGARFDLTVTFGESPAGLGMSIEYATDLFDRWRVEQLAGHVERVLTTVVERPTARLSEIALVGADERRRLLAWGAGVAVPYRRDPVHVAVEAAARRDPAAPAAVFEGDTLSYGELVRRARVLASHLRGAGVGHGDIVAVALDRGLDVLVALVGVLKAGAAFAVIDPGHPARRQRFVLRDTGARVVLTRSDLEASLPEPDGWAPVRLDTDWPAIEAGAGGPDPGGAWEELTTADSLAYVLYTSGSTGEPKGVQIDHGALALLTASYIRLCDLGPADRLLQYASLTFDVSEGEIFSALACGATLVMGAPDTLLSPRAVAALIREREVTHIGAPPAVLALLEPGPYPSLRIVVAAGEPLAADLAGRWAAPGRTVVNGYGPTEATVLCAAHVCGPGDGRASVPIGRPMDNRRLYVVDRWGDLAPVGVPGELLIGGTGGLGRGYLGRPELTAARFGPDPFRPVGRVCRSGDVVRWAPDGVLEFLGRSDNQVKLRGLRVELDEIAAVLETHPRVTHAVVAMRDDRLGNQQLVAYLVVNDPPPAPPDLRAHVLAELPAYMAPSAWVTLDALPLSPAGKVDRARLPDPDPDPDLAGPNGATARAPLTTDTERAIGAVLAEVLGIPAVGADDNFFDLGGTSLQAILVLSRLAELLDVTVPVRAVYNAGSVGELAAHVDGLLGPEAAAGAGPDELELLARVEDMSDEEVERLLAELDAGAGPPGEGAGDAP